MHINAPYCTNFRRPGQINTTAPNEWHTHTHMDFAFWCVCVICLHIYIYAYIYIYIWDTALTNQLYRGVMVCSFYKSTRLLSPNRPISPTVSSRFFNVHNVYLSFYNLSLSLSVNLLPLLRNVESNIEWVHEIVSLHRTCFVFSFSLSNLS